MSSANGSFLGWWPATPQNARFSYTVHGTAPPFAVAISGPDHIVRRQYATWTNASSGGTTPYTQQWSTFFPCPPPPPCTGMICTHGGETQLPDPAPMAESDPACGVWHNVGTGPSYTPRVFTASSFQLRLVSTDAAGATGSVTWTVLVSSGAREGQTAAATTGAATTEAAVRAGAGYETRLGEVYPNPARGAAAVRYSVAGPTPVRVALYDALGREVAVVTDEVVEAGAYEPRLDLSALPGGVYVVRMQAGAYAASQTLTLIR